MKDAKLELVNLTVLSLDIDIEEVGAADGYDESYVAPGASLTFETCWLLVRACQSLTSLAIRLLIREPETKQKPTLHCPSQLQDVTAPLSIVRALMDNGLNLATLTYLEATGDYTTRTISSNMHMHSTWPVSRASLASRRLLEGWNSSARAISVFILSGNCQTSSPTCRACAFSTLR